MQRGIDAPPLLESSVSPTGMLVAWSALAVAAAGLAVFLAFRNRDVLPVAACCGALICALNEPIYDVLAKLVYAETPHVAYSAFGRDIPWTLVVGYVPWVGLVPYLVSRLMAAGASRATLHLIAFALFVSVAAVEVVNALWLDAWKYYGESSLRGTLGGGIIQMAAMPLVCALLFYVFGRNTGGWRRALLGIAIPTMALPITFASTTWPLYVSNHARLPQGLDWGAAALSIAFCVAAVLAVSRLAHGWRAGEVALSGAGGHVNRLGEPAESTAATRS